MFYEKLVAFTGSRVAFTALTLSILGGGCLAFADPTQDTSSDVSKAVVTESSGKVLPVARLKNWMHRPSLIGGRKTETKDANLTWTSDPKAMQTTENIGANEVLAETPSTSAVQGETKKDDAAAVVVDQSTTTSTAVSEAPKVEGVKTDATKTETVSAEAAKIEAAKIEVPNTEAKVEGTTKNETQSNPATAKTEESLTDASKSEVAKTEESKSDAPKTDAPKADAGKAEGTQAPSKELAMIGGEVHTEAADGPVMIDNDEAVEVQQTIEYHDLETDAGGTKVKAGATFPVVISSQINSKSANSGDPFEARLKYDLKIKDRLIAEKGSTVIGHVNYVLKARSAMHSLISPERWYKNSGCLGISFDEIVNTKGEHIPLVATPARQARIIKNKAEGRELGVNHNGQVTGPWSQQLRYKAVRIGLNAAMAPAGVFSFGAMPVALGCIGAANPSFAFMKPVGQNVRHRRIKGFVWGALSGVPGSWVVEDTVIKGQEAVIKPGDEFLAEFKEEFTGEPETEASLIPGASTKVKGQVVPAKKGKK